MRFNRYIVMLRAALFLKIFLLILSAGLLAREAFGEGVVSVNMSMIAFKGPSLPLVFKGGMKAGEAYVVSSVLTSEINYYGDSRIWFYRSNDTQRPLAFADIPPGATDVILIFVQDDADKRYPYRVVVVEDRKKNLDVGGVRLYSFVNFPVAIKLGEERIIAEPGRSEFIKPALGPSRFLVPVKIAKETENGKHKYLHSSNWIVKEKSRLIVFITNNVRAKGHISLKMVYQPIN